MASRASPHGFVLVDRHIEKNAGSTFREILFQKELRGGCMYWGYQQRSVAWDLWLGAMRNLSADSVPPRICMEAHSHIDHVTPWLRRLEQLQELREQLARRAARVQFLLHLRLREPLSHYISYYLWTVVERQDRRPDRFGHTFEDWARTVPNLQTELLLSSKSAFTASFAPKSHKELKAWSARWETAGLHAERRALALKVVRSFDVLGTTKRFDETTLLVARALNWSVGDAASPVSHRDAAPQAAETCMARRRMAGAQLPWWCRVPGRDPIVEQRRVHRRVCPNATACAELIRAVAPVDHELYALARAHLDAAVAAAGPSWVEQLAQLRQLNKSPRLASQARCVWRTKFPRLLGGPAAEKNGRKLVYNAVPDFRSNSTACVPGDQAVMQHMWAEHRMGGRISVGWPMGMLVPYRRGSRYAYASAAGQSLAFPGARQSGRLSGRRSSRLEKLLGHRRRLQTKGAKQSTTTVA